MSINKIAHSAARGASGNRLHGGSVPDGELGRSIAGKSNPRPANS